MTAEPGAPLVTRNPTPDDVALRNNPGGTLATLGLLDVMVNCMPPAGAGCARLIDSVAVELKRFSELGVSVILAVPAVITTVLGWLFVKPSLTINCATYGPATSA